MTTNDMLIQLVNRLHSFTSSIMLTGSLASGLDGPLSDIDLIIICKKEEDIDTVRNAVPHVKLHDGRPLFDCKIYTDEEFSRAKAGKDHLFLWNSFQNSKCLSGRDISHGIKLNYRIVIDTLWNLVSEMEEVIRLIADRAQYTGCCFQIISACSMAYFVQKLILKEKPPGETKESYLRTILGSEYLVARERYYWVASRIGTGTTKSYRIPKDTDKKYGPKDYDAMVAPGQEVLRRFRQLITRVTERSEYI